MCSFKRQIPSLKNSLKWVDYKNKKRFNRLEIAYDWKAINGNKIIINAEKYLKENGWNISINENRISARKGVIGKLGPIIVHIGLIILLIGSAYGNLTNQTQEKYLRINEDLSLINDFNNEKLILKLNDFRIIRETDGTPKQFISDLSFNSTYDDEIEYKEAKVNHPLRYKGITIYQADWSISDVILKIDDLMYQLQLKPIPEIGDQIWGVLIELGKDTKKNYLLTIDNENGPVKFFESSNFDEIDAYTNDQVVEINSSKIEIKKIILSSGLIIKSDPSIPFVYSSFIFIIAGTILSLIPTKQIWMLFDKKEDMAYIGGLSNRNLSGFRAELKNLTEKIKKI